MGPSGSHPAPVGIGRWLLIWLGSFLLVASVLIAWFQIPLGPLLLGGGFTLVVTLMRFLLSRRQIRP